MLVLQVGKPGLILLVSQSLPLAFRRLVRAQRRVRADADVEVVWNVKAPRHLQGVRRHACGRVAGIPVEVPRTKIRHDALITLNLIRLVESPRGDLAQVVVIQRARQLRRSRRACGMARIEHLGRRAP